jgi:choline dehydrogenase-like flavoprotein
VKGGSAVNDYDVIVIGTGIAGGSIAARLAGYQ